MSILFEIKSRANNPIKIIFFLILKLKKLLKIDFENHLKKNNVKIDIIMPTMSFDIELLNEVIKSFKKLNHEINKVYRIASTEPEIIDFCNKNGIIFVDERELMGYGKEVIDYSFGADNRSGWIYQGLLKLSGDKVAEMDNYFIVDVDTIITSPFSLVENDKFIFYQNEEWHDFYFKTFRKLFGYKNKNKLSFTSHMMIFNKKLLGEMKDEIEKKYNMAWDKVYISMVDKSDQSCISDYDTYANWVLCNHPEKMIEKPLYNKAMNRKFLGEVLRNIDGYSKKYKTISFHHYIK